jgi:glycosyltransferase involved in cell wall biosynthesis
MATYHGADLVEEQIKSLYEQTVLPNGLVVRDDKSGDRTVEALGRLRKLSPFPFTILRGQHNLGYKANFVEALKHASADIYFFSDQDDVWLPRKIQEHLKIYEEQPNILTVISNQKIVGRNLESSEKTSLDEIRKIRGGDTEFVHGCCTSFTHRLHGVACAPKEGLGHDDWVHAIAEVCGQRHVIEEPLQLFRRHPKTTTTSRFNTVVDDISYKRRASAAQVIRNLQRKVDIYRSISLALKTSADLPLTIRQQGIKSSCKKADRAASRARNLERGLAGILPIASEALLGRQPLRKSVADIIRVVSNVFAKL